MANEGKEDDYRPDPNKIEEYERESKRAAAREEYKKAIEEAKLRDQTRKYELQLKLTPKLEETGIVESFLYRNDYSTVEVSLNHVYENVKVACDINKKKWNNTVETFERRLRSKGISKQHATMLSDVLDHNHQAILDLDIINKKQKQKEKQEQKETKQTAPPKELVTLTVPQAARCTGDGQYIQTQGIVTTVFKLRKLAKKSLFRCLSCGTLNESVTYRLGNDRPHLFDGPRAPKSCFNCEEGIFELSSEYLNAVVIELRDPDTFSDIDSLHAVLFDDDTNAIHIRIAEIATVKGHNYILEQPTNRRSIAYLYADSIRYESSEREVILTLLDEKAVFRFTKLKGNHNMLDVLANMFATDVVNELQAKKAIILAAASTGLDRTKKKINVGLVGSPGLAKSLLLRHAAKLVPGSRLESAQSSTGKGLTAAVTSKEGEGMILTTGAIPAAKGAIAALNEVGRISPDDQKYLLDVMEEQEFTINKADIHAKVLAPVAIIASCNPVQGEYQKDVDGEDIIDLNDFPAIMPLKDRFDLIIPIKSVNKKDEQKNREYAVTKLSRHAKRKKKIPPNYEEYVKRHIEVSKRFDPDLSDEAIDMLTNYYIEITKQSEHGSRRPLETITALSKLIAKLNLKNTVDEQDVKEVMQFYSEVSNAAGKILNLVTSPVESACKALVEILQTTGQPMTAAQLYNSACDQNPHIKDYLGDEPKIEKNWRLRGVVDKILQNNHIRAVQDKPKTLRWIDTQPGTNTKSDQDNGNNGNSCSSRQASDVSDVSDEVFSVSETENKKNIDFLQQDSQTPPSDTSDTSDSTKIQSEQSSTYYYQCYHCNSYQSNDEDDYKTHNVLKHPGKGAYPNKAEIEKRGLKPQGKDWEV